MNQSNQSNTTGSYYFKVSRTTNTTTYIIPHSIKVQEFFRVIKLHIMDDFGYNTTDDFELVLAGQQIPGIRHAEDVPAIDISIAGTGTLYENYTNSNAFYIRNLPLPNTCVNTATSVDTVMSVDTEPSPSTDQSVFRINEE